VQLTLQDASRFLNVPEATVTRWVKQCGLPAQHVGGKYRFHRTELLEWASANRIKVSPEMFDHLTSDEEPLPSVPQALEAGGIFYGLQATNKDRALRALVEVLPLPEGIDRELLLRLLLSREAAASTGIGDGIALPHVRNPIVLHVARPMVTLAFLKRPVEFGALDGRPVHVLFSLICPTTRSHLQMLARLSYSLHDGPFKDAVLRCAQSQEILEHARRVEETLGAAQSGGKD
jgi:PTS system nitrogen regulatory IIA component